MKKNDRRLSRCRLQHQEPTSDEVGMKSNDNRLSRCRLQHQEPTSDEVGMKKNDRRLSRCRLQHQEPTSDEVGITRWELLVLSVYNLFRTLDRNHRTHRFEPKIKLFLK